MFLNPNIYRLLIEKQELDTFIETNTIVPKYKEERLSLQDNSDYVEEFKNIVIVEKGTKIKIDESSDEEIVEISEKQKNQIRMTKLYLYQAVDVIQSKAKQVIISSSEGDEQRGLLMGLKRFTKYYEFPNTIELKNKIVLFI